MQSDGLGRPSGTLGTHHRAGELRFLINPSA